MNPRIVAIAFVGFIASGCSPAPEAKEPVASPRSEVAISSPSASTSASSAPLPDAPTRPPPRARPGNGERVIDGVVFRTVAHPIESAGGWGLEIVVEARSGDGATHRVGTQLHVTGKSWKVSDGKIGIGGFGSGGTNSLSAIAPGAPRELALRYPGAYNWAPIAAGWTLELSLRTSLKTQSGDIEQVTVGVVELEVSDSNKPKVTIRPPKSSDPE